MSLASSFTAFADDEGHRAAMDQLEQLQFALETCGECGNPAESAAASTLLASVRDAVRLIG